MEYKDYYRTIGVAKSASQADIQKAYRSLARKYHPDVNREDGAEDRFKEIGEAYEVLSDEEKRRRYDQFGSARTRAQQTGHAPPGWDGVRFDFGNGGADGFGFGESGFSSFFEMLFGGQGPHRGGGGTWSSAWPGGSAQPGGKGQDRESRLTLTLEDLAAGGKRRVELADPLTGQRKSLTVTIPKGVRPGQKIRLAGQGAAGADGPGDLYMVVELLPHDRFEVKGSDLYATLPVTPWQAALGDRAEVETLVGSVKIKLPPGSSSGRRIRLRGKGLPQGKEGRGDLYVEVKIVVPETLTSEEREAFEKLAEVSKFQARTDGSADQVN